MPRLYNLLSQSMLFTGTEPVARKSRATAFRTPDPFPVRAAELPDGLTDTHVRENPIWQFSWDPENPGTFTKVTIRSRGMGMDYGMPAKVYDRVEFRNVKVVRKGGAEVDLYLAPEYMIDAWYAREGALRGGDQPLWALSARLDASMMVAFGYKLENGRLTALSKAECDTLGPDLMPAPGHAPRTTEFAARTGVSAWARVDACRYIVVVELVLCRENNDFVPGGLIGFARIHPHAMIWANEKLERVEASIVLARPKKAMVHDSDSMHDAHKALVVADTNQTHEISARMELPLPYTDLLYDYYEVEPTQVFEGRKPRPGDHPRQREGEVTLADARFVRARTISNAIVRRSPHVGKDPDVMKEPRQGQFDNVHIAPRMRLWMDLAGAGPELVADDLAMLNMCLHDCCHMHVRWSRFLTDPVVCGWKGDSPNVEPGAPAVPENQTIFASFPNEHTLRYRAVAEGVSAGDLTVICHHGLGYAVDQWPGAEHAIFGLHLTLASLATMFEEPYWNGVATDKWALFYFRVRYCGAPNKGVGNGWVVSPRSEFDVETCMR